MKLKLIPPTFLSLVVMLSSCSKPPVVVDHTKDFQGAWLYIEQAKAGKDKEIDAVFVKDILQLVENTKTESGTTTELGGAAGGRSESFQIQVDATQTPGHIDFVILDGENQGRSRPGIFVFENDNLKICVAELNGTRPTEFVAAEKFKLMVLKRKKVEDSSLAQ